MHVKAQVRKSFADRMISHVPCVRAQVLPRRDDAMLEAAVEAGTFPIAIVSVVSSRISTETSGTGRITQVRDIDIDITLLDDVRPGHDTDLEDHAVEVEQALVDWQDLPIALRNLELVSDNLNELVPSDTGTLTGHTLRYTATVVTVEGAPDTSLFRS